MKKYFSIISTLIWLLSFLIWHVASCQIYGRTWLNTYGNDSVPFIFTPAQMCVDHSGFIYVVSTRDTSSYVNIIELDKYNSSGNKIWKRIYVNPLGYDATASCITVDSNNNVFVGGYDYAISQLDYLVLKYDSAGNFIWKFNYNAVGNDNDLLYAIQADAFGNIYATGSGSLSGDPYYYTDALTCKIDASGNLLWARYYNYPNNVTSSDQATFLKLNTVGEIIIGGRINNGLTVCKYDTSGNITWTGNPLSIYLNDIEVDDSSNIYLTGYYAQNLFLIKYDSSGINQWSKSLHYPNGGSLLSISPKDDFIYATGWAVFDTSHKSDVLLLKFDLNGDTLWTRHFNNANNLSDGGCKILCDRNNNLLITGSTETSQEDYDVLSLKYDTAGNFLWQQQDHDTTHNDFYVDAVLDSNGNIYTASNAFYYNQSYEVSKISAGGNLQWSDFREDFQNSYDGASKILMDHQGNIITGGISENRTIANDVLLLKYNLSGLLLWKKRIHYSKRNRMDLSQMICDTLDNIYLCGYLDSTGSGNSLEAFTAKINSAGNLNWFSLSDSMSWASSLSFDRENNLYVFGYTQFAQYGYNSTLAKYDTAGNMIWIKLIADSVMNSGQSFIYDGNETFYASLTKVNNPGALDISLVKLDTSGNVLWRKDFNGPASQVDIAEKLLLDRQHNPILVGYSDSINYDMVVIKYDSSGNYLWNFRYAGPGNNWDMPHGAALDDLDNIYVTGRSDDSNYVSGCLTFKLTPSGNLAWVDRYIGAGGYPAATGFAVTINNEQRVIVTGSAYDANVRSNVLVLAYDSLGNNIFTDLYNPGQGSVNEEKGADVLFDQYGSFYLAGQVDSRQNMTDFVTMKYVDLILGIENNQETNNAIEVFPNPSGNSFKISYYSKSTVLASIEIENLTGVKLFTMKIELKNEENQFEVNDLALSSGMYNVKLIKQTGEILTKKIISIR